MKENNLIELKTKYQKTFRELLHSNSFKQVLPESLKSSECFALFLLSINRPSDLCAFFGIHYLELESNMNNPNYITYHLKKKKKGFREINAPIGRLKVIQKKHKK